MKQIKITTTNKNIEKEDLYLIFKRFRCVRETVNSILVDDDQDFLNLYALLEKLGYKFIEQESKQ
jgi:hypothetical protein